MGRFGCGILIGFGIYWMLVTRLNMFFYEDILGLSMPPDGALAFFVLMKSTIIVWVTFLFLQRVAENYQEMRNNGEL